MDYLKQGSEPLFPKILWNRPLRSSGAGRLLLPGGHPGNFADIQAVYQLSLAAGAGQVSLALPDSLRALLAAVPDSHFLPSNPSGSLAKDALGPLLNLAAEVDALAVGADLSASSETTILVESLVQRADRRLIAFGDVFTSLKHDLKRLTGSPNNLIVATMPQLFALSDAAGVPIAIKSSDVTAKIAIVGNLSRATAASYVLVSRELIVGVGKQISLTTSVSAMDFFLPAAVALAGVFFMQNPAKPFEALTAAAFALRAAREHIAAPSEQALMVGELVKAVEQVLKEENF